MSHDPSGDSSSVFVQEAIHPHWHAWLRFDPSAGTVISIQRGGRGRFTRDGREITIHWERYPAEQFVEVDGLLVRTSLYDSIPLVERTCVARTPNGSLIRVSRVCARIPGTGMDVELRPFTSDALVFEQIFTNREYDSPHLPDEATTIMDLGANIGLASLFFAWRYPAARILAVEPDGSNFTQLTRNTAEHRARILTREGAVWTQDGTIGLLRENDLGKPIPEWGIRVTASGSPENVPCYSIPTLMSESGFGIVDILKCDIEGAEADIFAAGTSDWLDRVRLIIIETHDRFRPGSEATVRNALKAAFVELPRRGENLFFRRKTPARVSPA